MELIEDVMIMIMLKLDINTIKNITITSKKYMLILNKVSFWIKKFDIDGLIILNYKYNHYYYTYYYDWINEYIKCKKIYNKINLLWSDHNNYITCNINENDYYNLTKFDFGKNLPCDICNNIEIYLTIHKLDNLLLCYYSFYDNDEFQDDYYNAFDPEYCESRVIINEDLINNNNTKDLVIKLIYLLPNTVIKF
jgi:hypothetical protein